MRTVTAEKFKKIRHEMGLSCSEMANWLYIQGKWADRNIRRWEEGSAPIPGSVVKALDLAGWLDNDII